MPVKTNYYICLTNNELFSLYTEEPILVMYEQAVENDEKLLKLEKAEAIEIDGEMQYTFITIPLDSILYVLEDAK
ncbi:hypothetical protein vBEfaS95921_0034 [Enterococcus phage vB_EfaS_9592-1]|uniref:Uncharacterized protein n=2 Tax=Efquatrovirus LY0322 TaxID=2560427 RepID=A0A8E7D9I0_9CAUD|nr:hypothetical protein [Enterococcus phage FX417]QVU01987.1 hypothetical protein [Enterococcus phage vB_EfaS_785CC]QVU02052.1 hypothetical protein [Enterococcus phage vB_EfaS_785CS]WCS66466.1 hypothetical protein [Enterococcus phage DEfc27b]WJJ54377.1 hypothetical protein vBEfaS95921_0034 [Enterococcus phage vB_EfaS_9592-1]